MKTIKAFIERHPVLSYFALTFAISWAGILFVVGPGGISANRLPSDMQVALLYPALFVGPSVAGIVLTGLLYGREGFRDLLTRMTRWRVGARWYAVALLTAPLSIMAVLLAFSLTSPKFLPGIFTSDEKASLLLGGLAAGLVVGTFEELGWTGFAIPRMRLRYGVLATGLIVGLLWGAWHFLVFFLGISNPASNPSAGTLPPAFVLPVILFTFLPAYRVLMVWVYDRTESLLVTILMHASLVASLASLAPLTVSKGLFLVTYDLVWAAVLWVVVAVVAVANGGHLSQQPPLRRRRVA